MEPLRAYASSFIGSNPGMNVLPKEATASPGKTFPEVDQSEHLATGI